MAHLFLAPAFSHTRSSYSSQSSPSGIFPHLLPALEVGVACLLLLAAAGCKSSSPTNTHEPSAAKAVPATETTAKSAPMTADEIKQMKDRDDYATKLAKALHAKMPAYKNVDIYADNWTGTKPSVHGPYKDATTRTGDNLMLVFWSPTPDTANSLSDFTKSPAAVDAVNAGFAELQFVDPANYCYAQVNSVGAIGKPVCGIR